jgi:hypothetical protein
MKIRVQYLVKGKLVSLFVTCPSSYVHVSLPDPFLPEKVDKSISEVSAPMREIIIHSNDLMTMKMITNRQDYYLLWTANDLE